MGRITLPRTIENDIVNITEALQEVVDRSGKRDGALVVFVPGSTGAVSTLEFEPGLKEDVPTAMERLFPEGIPYKHDETWHDGNGHSHVRATFIGPSLTVPVENGKLVLGRWQQVVFLEFDNKPRNRWLAVQFLE